MADNGHDSPGQRSTPLGSRRRSSLGADRQAAGSNLSSANQIFMDDTSHFHTPMQQKKITQKQVMSHYFGFGSLELEKLCSPAHNNQMTEQEASGKFQQKLLAKQRLIEQQMIENRVRKLMQEEERLQKQIQIANKHSQFADKVKTRREEEAEQKERIKAIEEERIEKQKQANLAQKEQIKKSLVKKQIQVYEEAQKVRLDYQDTQAGGVMAIKAQRNQEILEKQMFVAKAYQKKLEVQNKQKMSRDVKLQSTTEFHKKEATQQKAIKERREVRIRNLEEMEQEMVQHLTRTLAAKNDAFSKLRDKNKCLQKTLEPRKAYKYMPREVNPEDIQKQTRAATMQRINNFSKASGSLSGSPSQQSIVVGSPGNTSHRNVQPAKFVSGQDYNKRFSVRSRSIAPNSTSGAGEAQGMRRSPSQMSNEFVVV